MKTFARNLAQFLLLAACSFAMETDFNSKVIGSTSTIRVMSYNLFGWNALHNDQKKENMFRHIRDFNPDILGVQEDEGQSSSIIGRIGHDYRYSKMQFEICSSVANSTNLNCLQVTTQKIGYEIANILV